MNLPKVKYPIYFINQDGNKCATINNNSKSADGTPRYTINPKCPENTYSLLTCMEQWKPVYKLEKGDTVQWKDYKLVVKTVKVRDELVRCGGVNDGSKTITWLHWLNFCDVKLLSN